MAAPEGSRANPVTVPRGVCAYAPAARQNKTKRATRIGKDYCVIVRQTGAGEAVEEGGRLGVLEVAGAARRALGFNAAEAVETPGGVHEFVEGYRLDCSLRIELGQERVLENGEFFLFVGADDEKPGGESMTD